MNDPTPTLAEVREALAILGPGPFLHDEDTDYDFLTDAFHHQVLWKSTLPRNIASLAVILNGLPELLDRLDKAEGRETA